MIPYVPELLHAAFPVVVLGGGAALVWKKELKSQRLGAALIAAHLLMLIRAFHFLILPYLDAARILPGMETEEMSGLFGFAGLWWAASLIPLLAGVRLLTRRPPGKEDGGGIS